MGPYPSLDFWGFSQYITVPFLQGAVLEPNEYRAKPENASNFIRMLGDVKATEGVDLVLYVDGEERYREALEAGADLPVGVYKVIATLESDDFDARPSEEVLLAVYNPSGSFVTRRLVCTRS